MIIESLFRAAKEIPLRAFDSLWAPTIPSNPENSREIVAFTQQLKDQGFSSEFIYSNEFSPKPQYRATDWRNEETRRVGVFQRVANNQYESVIIILPKLEERLSVPSQEYFSKVRVRFATTTDDGRPHSREVTFLDYLLQDPKACRLAVMAGPLGGRGIARVTQPAQRLNLTPV